ncbi:MAG: hypothetical protein H7Y27_04700 [Gemmatimonadaceae bacterium]|nr:hypothetical protein [Chitinophagaceae bacterium]
MQKGKVVGIDQQRARLLAEYELQRDQFFTPEWVSENTAILVIHGIGHQQPLQTLDEFSRGLIERYQQIFPTAISFEHQLNSLDKSGSTLFQNTVRIKHADHPMETIDIYEYYWAYCTQDKAKLSDINMWLQGVVRGAKKFYKRENEKLGSRFRDESIFFKDGKFIAWKYEFALNFISKTAILVNALTRAILYLLGFVPIIGKVAQEFLRKYFDSFFYSLSNLLGDIVIYNVTDEKSRFFSVRKQILDGATTALQSLLEKTENNELAYPKVVVAGHSLGSQIAYDAINRINLLANSGKMKYYLEDGNFNPSKRLKNLPQKLSGQLQGFLTFGSPLDKIAFFLRQQVPKCNYIWQQVIDSYHCFKQGTWTEPFARHQRLESSSIKPILEDVKWINYYDQQDIVSGRLDYFKNLENVDCQFKTRSQFCADPASFKHSHYWFCGDFYEDIIRNMLPNQQAVAESMDSNVGAWSTSVS